MARKYQTAQQRVSIVILGEGVTERAYFRGYKKSMKIPSNIKVEPQLPSSPDIKQMEKDAKWHIEQGADFVLCVVDKDDIIHKSKQSLYEAIRKRCNRKKSRIYFFESMPCFELWFFLHFDYTTSCYHDCDMFIRDMLKKHIPDYQKTERCILGHMDEFINRMIDAKSNAQRLRNHNKNDCPNDDALNCEIDLLLEKLHELIGSPPLSNEASRY